MSDFKASGEQITAMLAAAEAGDLATVKKLLSEGVDPNVRGKWKMTPLMCAAAKGHEEVFFTLVDAGADVHATRGYGDSMLSYAVSGDAPARLRMVQAIIAAGGLGPDDELASSFAHACLLSNVQVVRALLAEGADPNHEYFPLWSAVKMNKPDIVAELIRAGANVNIRIPRKDFEDNKHARKTLLEAAQAEGFTEVVNLLEAAGAEISRTSNRPVEPTPVADSCKRIVAWLKTNALNWKPLKEGVTAVEIIAAEEKIGFALPIDLRELYQAHDGNDSAIIFPCLDDITFYFMPLTSLARHWEMMKELTETDHFDDSRAKCDRGIKQKWWSGDWIPFAGNGGGDYLCVDIDPAKDGTKGQIIHFRHDAARRTVLAPTLRAYLFELANGLENGKYRYDGRCAIV